MTNYEKIMSNMTYMRLAELLTLTVQVQDIDDGVYDQYLNNAGRFIDFNDAITAEIAWLESEWKE